MAEYLKGDCINNAYTELRISGLTTIPSKEELTVALRRLEGMANEYSKRNVCIGYNFEDSPDLNTDSGIPPEYQESIDLCLARRLISMFGKGAMDKVDPELLKRQSAAFSYLSSATAVVKQTQPGRRMPRGSGNTLRSFRHSKFYTPVPDNTSCDTIYFEKDPDGVENYGINWVSWLEGETILTSEWTIESGITGYDETFDDTTTGIWFSGGTNGGSYQATNRVTASDGRITDRTITINIIDK